MVDTLSYFSFQPVLCDWCNKDRGMCYPVCGRVHIKEPLMLRVGGRGFLSRCLNGPLPYNRKENVLSVSLNKTFPSFLPFSLDEYMC